MHYWSNGNYVHFILVSIFVVVLNEKEILFRRLQYCCMWCDRREHMDIWVIEKNLCDPLRFLFEYPGVDYALADLLFI